MVCMYQPAMDSDWSRSTVGDQLLFLVDVLEEVENTSWVLWHPVVGPHCEVVVPHRPRFFFDLKRSKGEAYIQMNQAPSQGDFCWLHICTTKIPTMALIDKALDPGSHLSLV